MRSVKGKTLWVDFFKPNADDVASIKKLHSFHPLLLKEIGTPSARSRIEQYDGYLFIVHHFPIFDPIVKTSRKAEIDFLVTKDKVITIHYERLPQIDALFEALQKDAVLHKKILGVNTLMPVHYILERTTELALRQLRHIEENVSLIGKEIFNGNEEELLKRISYLKRDILDFKLITHPEEKLFTHLQTLGESFWGAKNKLYLSDLVNNHLPIHHNLENYHQAIESLETTNGQLLEAQTNARMKRLSVIAFLFWIPLYFVFFADFTYIHDIVAATPTRFWTFTVIIHIFPVVLWFIFKKKKYL